MFYGLEVIKVKAFLQFVKHNFTKYTLARELETLLSANMVAFYVW